MDFSSVLEKFSISMAELSRRYGIPRRTMEDWKADRRKAPEYVILLLDKVLENEELR